MAIFEYGEIRVEVDENGFMLQPEHWNREMAEALASLAGISALTDEHWRVINYIRDYHREFGIAPLIRKLCNETKFPLKKIYELFPSGPANGACRIAGLARPTGCI